MLWYIPRGTILHTDAKNPLRRRLSPPPGVLPLAQPPHLVPHRRASAASFARVPGAVSSSAAASFAFAPGPAASALPGSYITYLNPFSL